jgi:hypothetical protein
MELAWKQTYTLTGDNTRERPYADLYGRLTTRSNTYRIHYRVQILKKFTGAGSNASIFVDPAEKHPTSTPDGIASEVRGSYLVERYIDPFDSRWGSEGFVPLKGDGTGDTLTAAYRFRVLEEKVFNP